MNNGPLISSAGRNHVLLSKQFCILLSKKQHEFLKFLAAQGVANMFGAAVLLICGAFLFYRSQQSAVKRSLLTKEHVKQQNEVLKKKNEEMLEAKKQFEADEQE